MELSEFIEKLGYGYTTKKGNKVDNPFLKKLSNGQLSDNPDVCKSVCVVHEKEFKKQKIQKGYWIPYKSMYRQAWYDKAEDISKETGIKNPKLLKMLDHKFSILEMDDGKYIRYTMEKGHHFNCTEGKKVKQEFTDASGIVHYVGERVSGQNKYKKGICKVLVKLGLITEAQMKSYLNGNAIQMQPQQFQPQPQQQGQQQSGQQVKICTACQGRFTWKQLPNGKYAPNHLDTADGRCPNYSKN